MKESSIGRRAVNVYLGEDLYRRYQRVKDKIEVSKVCRDAVEAAITAEEKALSGDRLSRVALRLRAARTGAEAAEAEGEAAGRIWAEEQATLSELHSVRDLLNLFEQNGLWVGSVAVNEPYLRWELWSLPKDDAPPVPWDTNGWRIMPESIPHDVFAQLSGQEPSEVHLARFCAGFLNGAVGVLKAVEQMDMVDEQGATYSDSPRIQELERENLLLKEKVEHEVLLEQIDSIRRSRGDIKNRPPRTRGRTRL